jgi:hypothetical protein
MLCRSTGSAGISASKRKLRKKA